MDYHRYPDEEIRYQPTLILQGTSNEIATSPSNLQRERAKFHYDLIAIRT